MKRAISMFIIIGLVFVFQGCSSSSKDRYEELVTKSKAFEDFVSGFRQFDGTRLMNILYLDDFKDKDVRKFQKEVQELIKYDFPLCIYDTIVKKYNKNKLRELFNDEEALNSYKIAKKKYNISTNKLIIDVFNSSFTCSSKILEGVKQSYENIFDD
jgi:hypothetical protein